MCGVRERMNGGGDDLASASKMDPTGVGPRRLEIRPEVLAVVVVEFELPLPLLPLLCTRRRKARGVRQGVRIAMEAAADDIVADG